MTQFNHRTEALFQDCLELPSDGWVQFLESSCPDDPNLRETVLILLKAHKKAGAFMESNQVLEEDSANLAAELQRIAPSEETVGEQIGRYRLIELIGEGSWGAVWLAEQTEDIHRQVALKIIKLGLDTKKFLARFEAERQILAMMDHPNVAHILDAGATSYGRPYFVMELIRGMPLLDYADQKHLNTKERVELLIPVCQAIQHAHKKGIIHRDLKPTNILVAEQEDKPLPKVIDFGISKTTQFQLTDKTLYTEFHSFLGTPVYCSPEQLEFSGMEVDHRADIYSLGVLLYELLCGHPPFDPKYLSDQSFEKMREILREQDPPKPSSCFADLPADDKEAIARKNQSSSSKLEGSLRGDLDWIVMKCLEKDRSRRYESAAALGNDLISFLEEGPVSAAAPSIVYRIIKTITRRRPSYAIWLEVSLVAFVLLSSVFYFRSDPTPKIQLATTQEIADREKSIAVLPLENLSPDPENAYFAASFQDDIITSLSQIGELFVIRRRSTLGYSETTKSFKQIGEELGVWYLVEGSVSLFGEQIRVNIKLVDSQTGRHLWAEDYVLQKIVDNLLAMQSEIANAIAEKLKAVISPEEKQRIERMPTESWEALEAYFKGQENSKYGGSKQSFERAVEFYEQALSLDADFALAHAGLGRVSAMLVVRNLPEEEQYPKAEFHIRRALELDETLPEAYLALARLRRTQKNAEAAKAAFEKALEVDPTNVKAHVGLAWWYSSVMGDQNEALRLCEKVYELDPKNPANQDGLEFGLLHSGRHEEALKLRKSNVAEDPSDPGRHRKLMFLYHTLGRYDDAIMVARRDMNPTGIDFFLPRFYLDLGDSEKALVCLDWLVEDNERYRLFWLFLKNRIQGNDEETERVALEMLGNRSTDIYALRHLTYLDLSNGKLEEAEARLIQFHPELFDGSVELRADNVSAAILVATIWMTTGREEKARIMISKILTKLKSMGKRYFGGDDPLEAETHAISGDEAETLEAIKRYFDGGGSPYYLESLQGLELYFNHPEYLALAAPRKAELAIQLQRVRAMEASGKLPPIP